MTRKDLPKILHSILLELGGSARMMDIFKLFWNKYNDELIKSNDLFYTWNYDIRWAATKLRKQGKIKPITKSPKGVWEIY